LQKNPLHERFEREINKVFSLKSTGARRRVHFHYHESKLRWAIVQSTGTHTWS